MRLQNMGGWSSRSINSALNAIRQKANNDALKRCIIRDEQRFKEEHPEECIEVNEEKVEDVICTHSDLK